MKILFLHPKEREQRDYKLLRTLKQHKQLQVLVAYSVKHCRTLSFKHKPDICFIPATKRGVTASTFLRKPSGTVNMYKPKKQNSEISSARIYRAQRINPNVTEV